MTKKDVTFESIISKGGLDNSGRLRYMINVPIESLADIKDFGKDQVLINVEFDKKADGEITFAKKISNNGKTPSGVDKKMILIAQDKIDTIVKKNLGYSVTVNIKSL